MGNTLWTPERGLDTILPGVVTRTAKRGMELVDLPALGIVQGVRGGAPRLGTHVSADVVTQTVNGVDLNTIWTQFMALLNAVNDQRQGLIRFLSFPVIQPVETVAQPGDGVDFEEASEFGEPRGSRLQPTYWQMGFPFKWYDLGARYTWQYLADATSTMVESVANAAVEAYLRKQMFEVFKTIFNPTNGVANINQQAYNVYKFYNADGVVPPTYKNNTFDGNHTHYKTSGSSALEARDIDAMILDDFNSHGYNAESGYRIVVMAHSTVGEVIRGFRNAVSAGQSVAGNYGRYDFIPSQGQPGQLINVTQQLIGASPVSNTLDGLNVIGSYGPALIVSDDWMPTTHVFSFATGGSESLSNPVGIREHAQTNLRGLRLVKGRQANYPLIDSFWTTGFGMGIRHRGGGIVIEITADGTYEAPAIYA